MKITTGPVDFRGVVQVGLRIQVNEDDQDPVTYVLSPALARVVAFSLMTEADVLEPPVWLEE